MGLAISVIEELRRAGVKFEYLPGNWLRVRCPFHNDSTPSCDVCTEGTGGFVCHGCNAKGDFISFMSRLLNTERWVIIHDMQARYGDVNDRVLDVEPIEAYHQRLWKADTLLTELRKRAVTDEQIREYRLGEKGGKIVIPVKNAIGAYVNLVMYSPGAPKGTPKFHSLRGRGQARLYPIEQLNYDKIMLQGGPIKAIAASTRLNEQGIGSVCLSTGEVTWDMKLNVAFKGKDVAVCLDIDKAGRDGAEERCKALYPFANKIGDVLLPLDPRDYPKGDMNDFLASGGDPVAAYHSAKLWAPPKPIQEDLSDPIALGLVESYTASYSKKRVSIRAHVAAVDQVAYHLPKDVQVQCDKSQNMCGLCPVFGMDQNPIVALPREGSFILKLMGQSESIQKAAIMETVGIPECPIARFEVKTMFNVEDSRITPELDLQSRSSASESQAFVPAVCVDSRIELNETYLLEGKMMPHPYTQAATLVVSKSEPAVDSLSSFVLENPDDLRVFQPCSQDYDSLRAKLDDIWSDAELRVTRIYGRRELHTAIDIAYFSALFIPNRTETVKGWAEVLIIGDSSQGKSEASTKMMDFYGLGESVDCKNASVAGLVGGVAELGTKGRRFVKWGAFPKNDRRILRLEELKGLSREAFAKLTDMRSSGVAEIPKIERGKTAARTRILANSNPRSKRPVSAYNYGIDTVVELIPSLEDIRRFDLILILNKEDVNVARLSAQPHDRSQPKYDREKSRRLVLWAWTRPREKVVFTDACERELTESALRLCELFTDDIPILDRGSTRAKIGRLATAIAARVFSTEDYETLVVTENHVKFACDFIVEQYSSKSHGYYDYSVYVKERGKMRNSDEIINNILAAPHSKELANHLLNTTNIEPQDVCDWCGWDRVEAVPLMSCLVRNNALVREGRAYTKTPDFIALLQKSLENGVFKNVPGNVVNDKEKF